MYDHAFQVVSTADSLALHAYAWHPQSSPARATLVIAHGLGEHALRYARFARALAAVGFEVVAFDQRGHGKSLGPLGLGDPGEPAWKGLVADLRQLLELVRKQHPDRPLVAFGHSMGSLVVQDLCQHSSNVVDAVVLSGSMAYEQPAPGETLPRIVPNAAFEPARTPYDWLTRDPAEVDAYIADPLCGIHSRAMRLFAPENLLPIFDPAALTQIRPDLPVLLIAGDQDPLNRRLEALHLLERLWRKAGVRRIDTRYYPGGRHEMLNELNRDEVTHDLIAWLDQILSLAARPPA